MFASLNNRLRLSLLYKKDTAHKVTTLKLVVRTHWLFITKLTSVFGYQAFLACSDGGWMLQLGKKMPPSAGNLRLPCHALPVPKENINGLRRKHTDKIIWHHKGTSSFGSTKRSINVQIADSLEIIACPPICGDKLRDSTYFMPPASLNKSDCPHPPTKPTPEVYGKYWFFLTAFRSKMQCNKIAEDIYSLPS